MDFDEYQDIAKNFDLFDVSGDVKEPGFMAKVLGLCGESGEVAEKFNKILRDKNGALNEDDKKAIATELGDVPLLQDGDMQSATQVRSLKSSRNWPQKKAPRNSPCRIWPR